MIDPTEDMLEAGAAELCRLADHPDDLDICLSMYRAMLSVAPQSLFYDSAVAALKAAAPGISEVTRAAIARNIARRIRSGSPENARLSAILWIEDTY